jgi:Ca-activated chloride channel homolog
MSHFTGLRLWSIALIGALVPSLSATGTAGVQAAMVRMERDQVLSPFFVVQGEDPSIDAFPLQSTHVQVNISGVIAAVQVSQTYQNRGTKPLECIYVFPASTRAAVFGMEMTIGKRVIRAHIEERSRAERQYEQARDQGKTASLLEQQRPNVFQMKVANILPGDTVKTDLYYTELLAAKRNVYDFVFPTVVGPRYSTQLKSSSPASEEWISSPYQQEGEPPGQDFSLDLALSTGVPIRDLNCPSHSIEVTQSGPSLAAIRLSETDRRGANRDFILNYRLTGRTVESGILLYQGREENFFLAMIQPPRLVSPWERPPMEYVFVVDVSGSMHGFPLEISKGLVRTLLQSLRPSDRFNVIFFSGGSELLAPVSLPATPENLLSAFQLLERRQGAGGTELLPALRRILSIPRVNGMGRSILVLTDGFVSVERKAFDLIREELSDNSFFTFGIGHAVNRYLLEGMARVGKGEPWVVTVPEEAQAAAEAFAGYVGSPVITGIELDFQNFDAYDVDPPNVPALLAERPLIITGKWRGRPAGRIALSGFSAGGGWSEFVDVADAKLDPAHVALPFLWARERMAWLSDYGAPLPGTNDRAQALTELGLRYSLLTEYTSFVAIDTVVRADGSMVTIKQPLPLPEGVSNRAVSGYGFTAGVAGGVPGGLVGGMPGGVVAGVIGGTPRPIGPPVLSSPVRVGGSLQASKLIKRVEPEYPEKAKRARVQGIVFLMIEVDEQGNVVEAELKRGHPLLVKAAIEAVKKWKYQPTILNGAPVRVIAAVSINFVLRE